MKQKLFGLSVVDKIQNQGYGVILPLIEGLKGSGKETVEREKQVEFLKFGMKELDSVVESTYEGMGFLDLDLSTENEIGSKSLDQIMSLVTLAENTLRMDLSGYQTVNDIGMSLISPITESVGFLIGAIKSVEDDMNMDEALRDAHMEEVLSDVHQYFRFKNGKGLVDSFLNNLDEGSRLLSRYALRGYHNAIKLANNGLSGEGSQYLDKRFTSWLKGDLSAGFSESELENRYEEGFKQYLISTSDLGNVLDCSIDYEMKFDSFMKVGYVRQIIKSEAYGSEDERVNAETSLSCLDSAIKNLKSRDYSPLVEGMFVSALYGCFHTNLLTVAKGGIQSEDWTVTVGSVVQDMDSRGLKAKNEPSDFIPYIQKITSTIQSKAKAGITS